MRKSRHSKANVCKLANVLRVSVLGRSLKGRLKTRDLTTRHQIAAGGLTFYMQFRYRGSIEYRDT